MRLGSTSLDAGSLLEPPRHEPALGRYTTAIRVFESGPSSGDDDTAIVDVSLFGRTHMLRLSLVDTLTDFASHRPVLARLADGLSWQPGQRAADFVAGRDPVSLRMLDVVFGGRTLAEVTAEAAEEAAEAKRLAAMPKPASMSEQLKLVAFGILGLLSVVIGIFAFVWGGRAEREPVRTSTVDRAMRTAKR